MFLGLTACEGGTVAADYLWRRYVEDDAAARRQERCR